MAKPILAKPSSNSNLNSRRHIMLYQKVLHTGCQMSSLLSDYDAQMGPLVKANELVDKWSGLMTLLTKLLI